MFSYLIIFIILLNASDISGVIWPCKNNSDCILLSKNATCSNGGNCICPPGQVYSTKSVTCVDAVIFGDKCTESDECALMSSGAQCIDGVCQCQKYYTYVHGQCKKLNKLDEKCTQDNDCWFSYNRQSVICLNSQCSCAPGFYRRNSEICRQKSKEFEACVVHTDCETRNCTTFICVNDKMPKNYELNLKIETNNEENLIFNNEFEIDTKKFGDKCTEIGVECKGLHHSICIENVCYCQQGYYPHSKTKICHAELGEAASSLTCEQELKSDLCVCKKNYFSDDNLRTCRKPIAVTAPCTADNQCSPYAGFCKTDKPRKCVCPEYSEYDNNLQLCVKKQGLGTPCQENVDCPTINSICSSDKVCTCKNNYIEINGRCVAGIGADCLKNIDCKVDNAFCSKEDGDQKNTCMCSLEYVHVSQKCLKNAFEIGQNCTDNKQCETMQAKCVENNCICDHNQHYSYGKCELKKIIGELCVKEGECFMESNPKSIECRNSICSCKDPYQSDLDGVTCVKSNFGSSSASYGHFIKFTYIFNTFLLILSISTQLVNFLKAF